MLLIEFLLSKVSKRFQLSIQEWVIYATIGVGLGGFSAVGLGMHLFPSMYAVVLEEEFRPFIPNLWSPSQTTLNNRFRFGTTGTWMDVIRAVQWREWMWPLIYWYIFIVTLYLGAFFLITILRKQWIEVERLPFPGTVATYELIKRAKEHERPSLWTIATENLWFLIGFFIGFSIFLPSFLSYWGIITWPTGAWFVGSYDLDLTPYLGQMLPGAKLYYQWSSVVLPVVVFAPMDVLATGILLDIIFRMLLPIIFVKTGLVSTAAVGSRDPEGIIGVGEGPIRWGLFDLHGLGGFTYGLGFFLIAFQWRRIKDTLVAAIKGTKREEGETFSWRFVWIGFLICTIVWIYLLTIAFVPVVMALFVWGLIVCWLIFNTRLFAELAWWAPYATTQSVVIGDVGNYLGYWTTGEINQQGLSTILTYTTLTYVGPKDMGIRPATAMEQYKIGDMTETHSRSIGVSWILMTLVMVGFGLLVWMLVLYKFGIYAIYNRGYALVSWTIGDVYDRTRYGLLQGGITWWWKVSPYPYVIGGFILSGIILYLRTMFPWFFLNPIGVWAGMTIEYTATLRFMFIVGFVIKFLTLKIGGAKAYEKFLVPLIVGYAIGYGFAAFLTLPPQLMSVLGRV
jgi:hypothetical protein